MTIRILSFDFDGSLFNHHYLSSTKHDVIASNKKFLDAIKADNYLYSKSITLVGSNRQSKHADEINAYKLALRYGFIKVGSCFPAIQKITEYLDAELDTFLLADLYENLPYGTSFARALEALKDPNASMEHAHWLFDETKATVLYAQMQKKANEYPDEEIIFDFYDDRKDIIKSLIAFYGRYEELRPPNVTLRLHHYDGGKITTLAEFKSSSKTKRFIDTNYAQTVIEMSKIAKERFPAQDGIKKPLFIAETITPNLLKNRTPLKKGMGAVMKESTTSTETMGLHDSISVAKISGNDSEARNNRTDTLFSTQSSKPHSSILRKKINSVGVEVYSFFQSVKPGTDFPDSYKNIWDNNEGGSNKRRIKALLMDYTKENFFFGSFFGLLISGHWNRHHVDTVSKILANLTTRNYYESADEIVADLKALKPEKGGSLYRRIEFIEKKIEEQEVYNFSTLV